MANALQKWSPLREFERLHDEVDRLFRDSPIGEAATMQGSAWPVPVDIYEDDNELRVVLEVPGVNAGDVKVNVEGSTLTITGEKKHAFDEKKEKALRVERFYGSFSRSFSLPPHVNVEKIEAKYGDGVLTLHLPKKPETRPRQIQVKVK
ncbi:MAG: Hsp20/alpha crystallin family protein [Deltaproteobacteria bacterium]|nr:Hsp20/alpha crystallin family protein [Deltaproteobacteria bacterium]